MPAFVHSPTAARGNSAQALAQADVHREAVTMFRLTGDRDFLGSDQFFTTTFTTLNGSGVTGEAIVGYDRDTNSITVAISAAGLEPNMVHVQHIHGFTTTSPTHKPPRWRRTTTATVSLSLRKVWIPMVRSFSI